MRKEHRRLDYLRMNNKGMKRVRERAQEPPRRPPRRDLLLQNQNAIALATSSVCASNTSGIKKLQAPRTRTKLYKVLADKELAKIQLKQVTPISYLFHTLFIPFSYPFHTPPKHFSYPFHTLFTHISYPFHFCFVHKACVRRAPRVCWACARRALGVR